MEGGFAEETGEALEHVDQRVTLHGVTWEQFETVLAIRGDRSAPRMTYLEGELELTSPSKPHEHLKSLIGRLVEAYAEEAGLSLNAYALRGERYEIRERSEILPELDLRLLETFLGEPDQTRAIREFRAALRKR
jgi:hypothetical protein